MVRFRKDIGAEQQGVGLVEVLVALLVFSVGMLGVASLQVVSTKSSFEAQQRQQAVYLASDMLARMASSGMSLVEIKTNYQSSSNWLDTSSISDSIPTPNCNSSSCAPAEVAAWDKYSWKRAITAASVTHAAGGQGLVDAKGCVNFNEGENYIKVSVAWKSMTKMGDGSSNGSCQISGVANDRSQRHVELTWCPQAGC